MWNAEKMQNGHLVSIFSEVLQKTGSTSLWQAFPVNLNVAGRDDETTTNPGTLYASTATTAT